MPDSEFRTVSASQMPALFNRSPYATRWTLYKNFADKMPSFVDSEDARIQAGRDLEPVILRRVARELRLEVIANSEYLRHPTQPIGATADGFCLDPVKGLGFVEVKNVDWLRYKDTWTDREAPDAIEIQHQAQLAVPHKEFGLPKWGIIGCFVGGNELKLYERTPDLAVHERMFTKAAEFLADVRDRREPSVSGNPLELEGLAWAYPKADPEKILRDADFGDDAAAVAEAIDAFLLWGARRKDASEQYDGAKARILQIAADASFIHAHGRMVKITKSAIAARTQEVKAHVRTLVKASDGPSVGVAKEGALPPHIVAKLWGNA